MSDWDDEPVGYGRPPKHRQFRKGQTGNAKGRPSEKAKRAAVAVRGQSLADDILRAELREEVTIRDGKGTRKLTKQELVVKAQVKSAATGNPIAQKEVIRQARELEERDAERLRMAQEEAARNYEIGKSIHAHRTRVWAEAQALGQEPVQPWPHPDDVILSPEAQKWTIRGPGSADDVPHFEWIRALREVTFWSMMEQIKQPGAGSRFSTSYAFAMMCYDQRLPKRWQVGGAVSDVIDLCIHFELREIRAHKVVWQETVRLRQILQRIPPPDKECRQFAAKIMKPLIKPYGYRSLAEFERAWKRDGQKMPWPKDQRVI